ncbi:hypothetical protein FNW02_29305 [Komarekiella sp. 'clone 1']|uniref:Uncharacterized protein n=1 Tax=Komarekiella delphini-convector SJRDD-AB1 TaxID=2593771 RepID=A0AA40T2M7_9NOST|nr:hypothetical protein [Komarekiella delphini-convector SJRDD-AB1]
MCNRKRSFLLLLVAINPRSCFERRERSQREGRNLKTNEPMIIPATKVSVFSAGKLFKEKVAP